MKKRKLLSLTLFPAFLGMLIACSGGGSSSSTSQGGSSSSPSSQSSSGSGEIELHGTLSLNKDSLPLVTNNTDVIVASYQKANNDPDYSNVPYNWTISDAGIASISPNKQQCSIKAIKAGTATLTLSFANLTKTASIIVSDPAPIPVSSVFLSKTTSSLSVDSEETLIATVLPVNASEKTVSWSSSNPTIATVNNGKVTAVSVGNTTITASCGGKSATCVYTVTAKVIPVTSVTVNKTSLELSVGGSETLTAEVLPVDATSKVVSWLSSNSSVASVDSNTGLVTALSEGNAVITAKAGDKTDTCNVTVTAPVVPVTSVDITESSVDLEAGENTTLHTTVLPTDASYKVVSWESNDLTVASVDNSGVVTALASGTATITASCGGKSDTCTINVSAPVVPVTAVNLSSYSESLVVGSNVTLEATVVPSTATSKTVSWSSDNPSVATVESGVVTAVTAGTANIVATAGGVDSTACVVTVTSAPVPVTSVTLDIHSASVEEGLTQTLTATVLPTDATSRTVTWTSDNTSVATVVEGVVNAISVGTATITASCGGFSDTCDITVTAAPVVPDYSYSINSGATVGMTKTGTEGNYEYTATNVTVSADDTIEFYQGSSKMESYSVDYDTLVFFNNDTGTLTTKADGTFNFYYVENETALYTTTTLDSGIYKINASTGYAPTSESRVCDNPTTEDVVVDLAMVAEETIKFVSVNDDHVANWKVFGTDEIDLPENTSYNLTGDIVSSVAATYRFTMNKTDGKVYISDVPVIHTYTYKINDGTASAMSKTGEGESAQIEASNVVLTAGDTFKMYDNDTLISDVSYLDDTGIFFTVDAGVLTAKADGTFNFFYVFSQTKIYVTTTLEEGIYKVSEATGWAPAIGNKVSDNPTSEEITADLALILDDEFKFVTINDEAKASWKGFGTEPSSLPSGLAYSDGINSNLVCTTSGNYRFYMAVDGLIYVTSVPVELEVYYIQNSLDPVKMSKNEDQYEATVTFAKNDTIYFQDQSSTQYKTYLLDDTGNMFFDNSTGTLTAKAAGEMSFYFVVKNSIIYVTTSLSDGVYYISSASSWAPDATSYICAAPASESEVNFNYEFVKDVETRFVTILSGKGYYDNFADKTFPENISLSGDNLVASVTTTLTVYVKDTLEVYVTNVASGYSYLINGSNKTSLVANPSTPGEYMVTNISLVKDDTISFVADDGSTLVDYVLDDTASLFFSCTNKVLTSRGTGSFNFYYKPASGNVYVTTNLEDGFYIIEEATNWIPVEGEHASLPVEPDTFTQFATPLANGDCIKYVKVKNGTASYMTFYTDSSALPTGLSYDANGNLVASKDITVLIYAYTTNVTYVYNCFEYAANGGYKSPMNYNLDKNEYSVTDAELPGSGVVTLYIYKNGEAVSSITLKPLCGIGSAISISNNAITINEAGTYDFYVDGSNDQLWVNKVGTYYVNLVDESQASWAFDSGIPCFAACINSKGETTWVSVSFEGSKTAKVARFEGTNDMVKFAIVRCAPGTTTPDWNITSGDAPGRIYNKTADVNVVPDTTLYGITFTDYPG